MFHTVIIVATSFFIVLLFLNLYFRIKLLGIYRKLREGHVEFPTSIILNTQKLKEEIVPKYPGYEREIISFSRHLKFSLRVAFVVFIIALFLGYMYVKFR